MNVIDIIEEGLFKKGYDGLVYNNVCGCKSGDLSPGNCLDETCEPGYLHEHSKTKEWIISTEKEKMSDEKIQEIIESI